jgi:hypothetical protein
MIKHKILFFLVVSFFLAATVQNKDEISWTADYHLKWDDFKAKVAVGNKFSALTHSGFTASYSSVGNKVDFNVQSTMERDKSWVKPEKKTDYLLKHEQGHFDITEIFTRKLRKRLVEKKFKSKTFESEYHSIYENTLKELHSEQEKYDDETEHSIAEKKQEEWNLKITKQLEELDNYKETHYTSTFK